MPKMKAAFFGEPGRIVLESKPIPDVSDVAIDALGSQATFVGALRVLCQSAQRRPQGRRRRIALEKRT